MVEITKAEDAVLQRTPVMREKETVMDPGTEVAMMVMMAVEGICSVAATTARNLVTIIMKRMIAARNQSLHVNQRFHMNQNQEKLIFFLFLLDH